MRRGLKGYWISYVDYGLQDRSMWTRSIFTCIAHPGYSHHTRKHWSRALSSQPDDVHRLRPLFDCPDYWTRFRNANFRSRKCGLIRNAYLKKPSGFIQYANGARKKCEREYEHILQARSSQELSKIPRRLDFLSNQLCGVLDLADFVRITHQNREFRDAAEEAYCRLWNYMNILNTSSELKDKLELCMEDSDINKDWSSEERAVAKTLLNDFKRSAVDMPAASRNRFVELCDRIRMLGNEFASNVGNSSFQIDLDQYGLELVPDALATYRTPSGGFSLPVGSHEANILLSLIKSSSARRTVYSKARTVSPKQIDVLQEMLKARYDLAKLSGFPSYAHLNLSNKMARSPEAVNSFLVSLHNDNRTLVETELTCLSGIKSSYEDTAHLEPWDLSFYQHRAREKNVNQMPGSEHLMGYFSLGSVMLGLSYIFNSLFGITLMPSEMPDGESWGKDVRRLNVNHNESGLVAVLYCDFFNTINTACNPAHYTLQSSREIFPDEEQAVEWVDAEGSAYAIEHASGKLRQIPIIALVCSFEKSSDRSRPTLLTFQDVQTLYHEMGHALHSILGRTRFQVVSGTRCPTDFAEIPSILMEHFASDEHVLSTFGRHWQTSQPIPHEAVSELKNRQHAFSGLRTETQIIYSLLDQAYHSEASALHNFSTSQIYMAIQHRYGTLYDTTACTPQGLFGHLYEYGGSYYSYLFDQAIAKKIWLDVFKDGSKGHVLDRQSGRRLNDHLLKWGGAKDPWTCLSDLLEDDSLRHGGPVAMEKVGQWSP